MTIGTEAKLVPVIVTCVEVLGGIVDGLILLTAGAVPPPPPEIVENERLFAIDKYILPNRFVDGNIGIKETDDFIEKMFEKSTMGKFGRFYFTGKWLFIFYMSISFILMLILFYFAAPNLYLLSMIILISLILILHILWIRINKKN